MEKFNLNYSHRDYDEIDHYDSSVTFNVERAYLWDVLEKIEQFLRGSGFHFDGKLKIVGDNETIVPTSFVSDSINKEAYRHTDVGSPVEVTKSFEQGINITNTGNVASPVYPDEGHDAWHRGKVAYV
jgi:hypothetical protein